MGALCAACLLFLPVCVNAADERTLVTDDAGLYTSAEEEQLNTKANELSAKYDTNVFVLTSNQTGFSDNYARDVIEAYGTENYPEGYIGYMVDMADRSYWVDAYGTKEREIFTQSIVNDLTDIAYRSLREGEYARAASNVLSEIGNQFEIAQPMGWLKKPLLYPMKTLMIVGGSLLAGLIGAGILTGIKVSRHKDKGIAVAADQYGSGFRLTSHDDRFVRHYQTRVPKPKPQSSGGGGGFGGGGSSGHTGGGGHF